MGKIVAHAKWQDSSCELFASNDKERLVQVHLQDVVRLLLARSGSELFADDQQFFIIERKNDLIIVPEMTDYWESGLESQWIKPLASSGRLFKVYCDPPRHWTTKVLFFFSGWSVRLSIQPKDLDKDRFSIEGPIDASAWLN